MKIKIKIMVLLMCLSPMVRAQTATPTQSDLGIFRFPLFERAVRCIKFYEGWHDIKRNYPYIGWGHCVQPHENFKKNLTLEQADSLLRSDLRTFCGTFFYLQALYTAPHCKQALPTAMNPYRTCGTFRKRFSGHCVAASPLAPMSGFS